MKIVIEGNDGTGKSTLVEMLKLLGYENISDRGILTKMTDDVNLQPNPNELYIILDASVEVSHARLKACGKPMEEYYHTIEALTLYRRRYQEIAKQLGDQCVVIDSSQSRWYVVKVAVTAIEACLSKEKYLSRAKD